jgi:hypothetical protein
MSVSRIVTPVMSLVDGNSVIAPNSWSSLQKTPPHR